MNPTRAQKKYLGKNLGRVSFSELASYLRVGREELIDYCKIHFPDEYGKKTRSKKSEGFFLFHQGGSLRNFLKSNWKEFLLLTMLVFICYANTFNHDFVSDDISGIKNNPNIGETSHFLTLPFINMRGFIIFVVYKLFGTVPLFFRLVNILFHLGSSFLVYAILYLFFGSSVAFLAAAIFAVHPLEIEAVTWISGGPYSNGAFFALLSLLTYILSQKNRKLYFVSVVSFIVSSMFSEKLVTFPLVFLLLEILSGNLKKNLGKILPFFAISLLFFLKLIGLVSGRIVSLEQEYYQTSGFDNIILKIPLAITSYLELIFWPINLTFYHAEPLVWQGYYIRLFVFISFLIFIFFLYKKERKLFFWAVFFFIPLMHSLTPLRIAWVVAERYAYLSALGIYALVAYLLLTYTVKIKDPNISLIIFVFIITLLSVRTIIRNFDWQNEDALWVATAKTAPFDPKTHNNMGDFYSRRGDYKNAAKEFMIATQLNPNYADAYHNLANTYFQMKREDLAIENYKKAVSINSRLWQSYQNLAVIYFNRKEANLALDYLKKAIEINPGSHELYLNTGVVFISLNRKEEAKRALIKALELEPNNKRARKLILELR